LLSGRIMVDGLQKKFGSAASGISYLLGMWGSWSGYEFLCFELL